MIWEPILKEYPDDTENIKQARKIHEFICNAIQKAAVPELDPAKVQEDIYSYLDYDLLSVICSNAWKNVLACEPDIDMHEAIRAFIKDEHLSDMPEEKQDRTAMFVRPAVTQYLNALREKNKWLARGIQKYGECPFCHAYPRIAFDSDGARKMSCLLCGQEWEFSRIKCPYCGNNDHETLGYFEVDSIKGVKVYYCDECKYYVKVIDSRVRKVHDAETEDILTLVMDDIARDEGYV